MPRDVYIDDTRTGRVQLLEPRDPGRVGIYACGPTVYSRIHIGNARPFVIFSLLKRFLEHEGYEVRLVINVTDVNDKIYDAARAQGRPSAELAEEMTACYHADTDALGLGRPDHEPLASETIGPIVEHIETLIERGHAYPVDGDVYFRVRSDPATARSRTASSTTWTRARMDQVPSSRERKQDPLDFALWKARKEGEDTSWDSPWGRGRPGWHIECSAMAEALLGVGFDIHGGGSDLLFPHHENEAAQTRAARGAELAKLWMHNGMIQLTGEKMAKSAGNIAPLHEVLEQYGAETVVMYSSRGTIDSRSRSHRLSSRMPIGGSIESATRCAAWSQGAKAPRTWPSTRRHSSPLSPTTSIPPLRLRGCSSGSGRRTGAASLSAMSICARCWR